MLVGNEEDVNTLRQELTQMHHRKVFLENIDPDAEVRE